MCMECPTPCVCDRLVELHDMKGVERETLPDGAKCPVCEGSGDCKECQGRGWSVSSTSAERGSDAESADPVGWNRAKRGNSVGYFEFLPEGWEWD